MNVPKHKSIIQIPGASHRSLISILHFQFSITSPNLTECYVPAKCSFTSPTVNFPIMEQAGRGNARSPAVFSNTSEKCSRRQAAAAGRDDRNADHLHNCLESALGQTGLGASLSASSPAGPPAPRFIGLFRPRPRHTGQVRLPPATSDLEAGRHFGVRTRVDRNHSTLAAVLLRSGVHPDRDSPTPRNW